MKKLTLLLVLFIPFITYAQKYETLSRVKIPDNAIITKTVKAKGCNEKIDAGYVVKTEYTKKHDNKTYTFTKIDTLKKDSTYPIDKEVRIKMKNFGGDASLTIDENDKTRLIVNYWLNEENEVEQGTKIKVIKRTLQCPKGEVPVKDDYTKNDTTYILEKKTNYLLWKVEDDSGSRWFEKMDWYIHSDKVIEVYDEDDKIDYYLVNKYDRKANYEMKLENREFISYANRNAEFGPLTIPFKYRFGYTKDTVEVKQQFDADLNIGFFAGYRLGKYRVRYEGRSFKKLANISCTIGGFLSLSAAKLDENGTTAGKAPFAEGEEASIGVLSPGIGIMLDVYNVNIGGFLGWDVGFGNEAKNWNFNNRPWIGIGIGYNLNGFWKD